MNPTYTDLFLDASFLHNSSIMSYDYDFVLWPTPKCFSLTCLLCGAISFCSCQTTIDLYDSQWKKFNVKFYYICATHTHTHQNPFPFYVLELCMETSVQLWRFFFHRLWIIQMQLKDMVPISLNNFIINQYFIGDIS